MIENLLEAMRAEATAGGNGVVFASFFALALLAFFRPKKNNYTSWANMFLAGCVGLGLGVSLRIGQWLLAQIFRLSETDRYHPLIFDVRDSITILAAILCSVGIALCIGSVWRKGSYPIWIAVGFTWCASWWGVTSYITWARWN